MSPDLEPPMRRDRDGDLVPDVAPAHHCESGWRGHDPEGRPIPCLTCKPHLTHRRPTRAHADQPIHR